MEADVSNAWVIKDNRGFILLSATGEMSDRAESPFGLYSDDTRLVRSFDVRLNGRSANYISAVRSGPNRLDFYYDCGSGEIARTLILKDSHVYEHWRITDCQPGMEIRFYTGYQDIFDVRDDRVRCLPIAEKPVRGKIISTEESSHHYEEAFVFNASQRRYAIGLRSSTKLERRGEGRFSVECPPSGDIYFSYGLKESCLGEDTKKAFISADKAESQNSLRLQKLGPEIASSDPDFHAALQKAQWDISSLLTECGTGLYPYAGLPWFSCPFGRDALMTAFLLLKTYPDICKNVLLFQSRHQATSSDIVRQAEPGKIFHEMRFGESSRLNENPFGLYYGGVDTTPLYVMTAYDYYRHTGDGVTIRAIWPNLKKALSWITANMDRYGGYLRYNYDPNGLTQQGWKDSHDSIFHADTPDDIAPYPIALCEVQAYAHNALAAGALFAEKFDNDNALACEFIKRKDDLKTNFNQDFWINDLNCFALALDGQDSPCALVSSNAGHCLNSDIIPQDRIPKLIETLMSEKSFSGYGIRTLAKGPGYHPLSYHRGSVWPHDTAFIGLGMARHGHHDACRLIADALYEVIYQTGSMPELLSGAQRMDGKGPEAYPSACLVQAWSAAAFLAISLASHTTTLETQSKLVIHNRQAK